MKSVRGKQRVGVVMGGGSGEREVSLRTGEGVADALEALGHDVERVVVGAGREGVERLLAARMDVAFLALHGKGGEDGCAQGLLELIGVPYTGSSVLASALAMDKAKSKELFRLHNVPTPPYYTLRAEDLGDLDDLHGAFGFPAVVKPRAEGSSLGVTKVTDAAGLRRALAAAFALDEVAVVERFVAGTEVHVGLLDGRVLGAVEVVPRSGFYDYAAKYTPGATEYVTPPRVPSARMRGVFALAERAAKVLGATGACRVDLLVTPGENEYVLEVNTLPGMTPTSLLPKIAEGAGLAYGALCEAILAGARLHGRPAGIADAAAARPAPRASGVSLVAGRVDAEVRATG